MLTAEQELYRIKGRTVLFKLHAMLIFIATNGSLCYNIVMACYTPTII